VTLTCGASDGHRHRCPTGTRPWHRSAPHATHRRHRSAPTRRGPASNCSHMPRASNGEVPPRSGSERRLRPYARTAQVSILLRPRCRQPIGPEGAAVKRNPRSGRPQQRRRSGVLLRGGRHEIAARRSSLSDPFRSATAPHPHRCPGPRARAGERHARGMRATERAVRGRPCTV